MKTGSLPGLRKALYILVAVAGVIILAGGIFILTFDVNSYKGRIEAAASGATGMDVKIGGGMRVALFPLGVSAEDIRVENGGLKVARVKKAALEIDPWPLLGRRLQVQRVVLEEPDVSIVKDKSGRYNFEHPGEAPGGMGTVSVDRISVRDGHLAYRDDKTGGTVVVDGCDMEINGLSAKGGGLIGSLSLDGELFCLELQAGGVKLAGVRATVKARGGILEAAPVTANVLGGDGTGSLEIDTTGESPKYTADISVTGLRFEEALAAYKKDKAIRGGLEVKAHIETSGRDARGMKKSARGEVSIHGRDLHLDSIDVDRLVEKFERSQDVGLVDIGSFFVLGPFGPLITKSYEFGSVYEESLGGRSVIRVLVSDWDIRDGAADAKDVAFSTAENRVALKGRINFVKERFDNLEIAVLDEKGCPKYIERINGSFAHPEVERPGTLETMAGPVLSIFKKAGKLLSGGRCDVFYSGSVKQP